MVKPGELPGPCEPGELPGTVRTVLSKPGVECSPDLPRVAASERERTHKSQTRRSAPTKVQPSHPRGGARFMMNILTCELFLPSRTANQYLA